MPAPRVQGLLVATYPNIIGLSYSDLGTDPDTTTSRSGLYIDELNDLPLKMVAGNEPNKDLLVKLRDSRRDAYGDLETDILAGLQTLNGPQVGRYVGTIGGTGGYAGVVDVPDGTELSITLRPKPDTNARIKIKRIGLLLAADANVDVYLSAVQGPYPIVATADTPSFYTLTTPLELDLFNCEPLKVSYTVNGFMARNNSQSCGCTAMDGRLATFFYGMLKESANGILLDVEVGNSESQVIVDAYEINEAIQGIIAHALLFKSAELLIERIIASDEISRYTTMDRQYLWGKRNEFRASYTQRLNWLVSRDGIRAPANPENLDRTVHMGTILL